jgi:hypothetical protein
MLGSLARKLRAFGFDTSYYGKGDDEGIITLAASQHRIMLTADRTLRDRALSRGATAFLVSGSTDGRRISSILASALDAGTRIVRGPPLCSVCGGSLLKVPRRHAADLVPSGVARRHRLFLRCTACGRVYWRGSHWKKLRNLERAFGPRKKSYGDP